MIIAYHAIWTTYGTWLPNDPRGSYSVKVYRDELQALGEIRYGRQDPQPPKALLRRFWTAASPRLSRPPFFLDDRTRPVVAAAMEEVTQRLGLTVRACAVMNDHVHVLVERGRHRIEYLMNQWKGAATRRLQSAATPWTYKGWKVFINDEPTARAAAKYIEMNPTVAGMPPQHWSFVVPYPAWYTSH